MSRHSIPNRRFPGRIELTAALGVAVIAAVMSATATLSPDPSLVDAVLDGRTDKVRIELQRGTDPDRSDGTTTILPRNTTPLMAAAFRGDAAIVTMLLEAGASPEQRDAHGWTALHYAACWGGHEVVRTLLDGPRRSDVNAAGRNGWTPVMLAAARDRPETAEMLIAAGADAERMNRWGQSAAAWREANDAGQ